MKPITKEWSAVFVASTLLCLNIPLSSFQKHLVNGYSAA